MQQSAWASDMGGGDKGRPPVGLLGLQPPLALLVDHGFSWPNARPGRPAFVGVSLRLGQGQALESWAQALVEEGRNTGRPPERARQLHGRPQASRKKKARVRTRHMLKSLYPGTTISAQNRPTLPSEFTHRSRAHLLDPFFP